MPRDVSNFFEQYRDAFDRLDGDAIADLFCIPSGIVSDGGLTAWQSREPNCRKHGRFVRTLPQERLQACPL